ncbi:MAG: putative DNA-binding domain-containing protein [Pseudomonadota bacterium]
MASAMLEKKSLQAKQYEFAAYIRAPENNPAPTGVEKRRIDMYRALFFNNILGFLGNSFPVLRGILGESRWTEIARDFFSRHKSKTPYFSEIPEEFLIYLMSEREQSADDPPFMLELAHYEWVEMALAISTAETPEGGPFGLHDDPLGCVVSLSDLAWPLAYRFPVHRLSSDFQPEQPPDRSTYLLVYRSADDPVRFFECSPVSFGLLQLLHENDDSTLRECLLQIASVLNHPNPDVILETGMDMVRDLVAMGVLGRGGDYG